MPDSTPQAYVFDAIRTPRGKGKKDGSLYEVKPVNLLAGVLGELQRRNQLDTSQVDDVVMGVVSPVGEQGSVIAKVAALKAGWDFRCSGVQLNRFCASGLEAVNMAIERLELPVLRVAHADAIGNPKEVAARVKEFLKLPLDVDAMAGIIDPKLHRQRGK